MFWSDLHSIQLVPSLSVKTRGSIEPPWPRWQMNGSGLAVKGRRGPELAVPDALHRRRAPRTTAVK